MAVCGLLISPYTSMIFTRSASRIISKFKPARAACSAPSALVRE
jgi:hypothetical protein